MNARRSLAAGFMLVVAVALAGCGGWTQRGSIRADGPSGRVAYVAADDHVYTIAAEGGAPRRVDAIPGEQPVAGELRVSRWPTWTPDGSRLAFMRLRSGEGNEAASAAIWSVAADGSDLVKVWESREFAPIYMAWSPDASALGVLIQRTGGLALILLDPSGSRPPREIAGGNPLYFAWSPDASRLFLHVGGDHRSNARADLSIVTPGASDQRESLSAHPADFRVPAWSPDGTRFAFVAEGPDRSGVLTTAAAQGSDAVRLASISDEAAFVWSPDGEWFAFSTRSDGSGPFYRGLEVARHNGTGRVQVAQEPVMAFFWSPDASRIAFAALDRQAQALTWYVCDADGRNKRQVGSFIPSEEQIRHFAFFDQYALSHGLWSPDGRYLAYAGMPSGTRDALGNQRNSSVFLVPADGSAPPRVLVDGVLATWPTRPHRPR